MSFGVLGLRNATKQANSNTQTDSIRELFAFNLYANSTATKVVAVNCGSALPLGAHIYIYIYLCIYSTSNKVHAHVPSGGIVCARYLSTNTVAQTPMARRRVCCAWSSVGALWVVRGNGTVWRSLFHDYRCVNLGRRTQDARKTYEYTVYAYNHNNNNSSSSCTAKWHTPRATPCGPYGFFSGGVYYFNRRALNRATKGARKVVKMKIDDTRKCCRWNVGCASLVCKLAKTSALIQPRYAWLH